MFQARRRRESGKGNTNGHEDKLAKAKKRPYRWMNELNESEDDDDDDNEEQQERSFVNQQTTSESAKYSSESYTQDEVKLEEV